jgi:hypothetical protein
MNAHTPGPWYVTLNPYRVGHRGPLGVLTLVAECPTRTGLTEDGQAHKSLPPDAEIFADEARANAAFIVRACNSHDALKDAADNAVDFIEQLTRDTIHADNGEYFAGKLRAALKLARGEA